MYNIKVQRLLRSLDKAYQGPVMSTKEWDTKILPKTIKGILKKYGLARTLDMDNPINCDDDLADTFFKAGRELALELGIFCEDTERVIKMTEDELLETIRDYPDHLILGEGQDEVVMFPRRPESELCLLYTSCITSLDRWSRAKALSRPAWRLWTSPKPSTPYSGFPKGKMLLRCTRM